MSVQHLFARPGGLNTIQRAKDILHPLDIPLGLEIVIFNLAVG